MRILVTGSTGFIGREVAAKLTAEGSDVTGIARKTNDDKSLFSVDIGDRSAVEEFAKGRRFDAVVHAAGLAHQFGNIPAGDFFRVNVDGSENVARLAVATGASRFILLSSVAVYGFQNSPMDESSPCKPENPYAESKLRAEEVCRSVCRKADIDLTVLRLAPVLGEKGVGNVPRLITMIHRGRFIWVGDGENAKSLAYVGDIAEAVSKILNSPPSKSEIYNLAAEPVKMKRLVEMIAVELGRTTSKLRIPAALPLAAISLNRKTFNIGIANRIGQVVERWLSDDIYPAGKLEKDFGFSPRTPIEEAVRKQCEWFLRSLPKL